MKHRENSKRSIDKGLRQERIEKAIGSETNCFFYFIDIASKYKSTHSGFFCCIDVWLKIINKETFFEKMDKMADDALASGSPGNTIKEVTKEDILHIYKKLWEA